MKLSEKRPIKKPEKVLPHPIIPISCPEKLPVEIKHYACKCGETFTCIITARQRIIHNRHGGREVPVETGYCTCHCGGVFECKITSKIDLVI